nr:MAG TPA: hypothetical protein [Caudoviricetes sp.]
MCCIINKKKHVRIVYNLSVLVDFPLSNEDLKVGSKVENNNYRW